MNPEAILALLSDLRTEVARLRQVIVEKDAEIAKMSDRAT